MQNIHKKVAARGPTIFLRRHVDDLQEADVAAAAAEDQVRLEVLNKLGSGGFGTVYRAKVIRPASLHHPQLQLASPKQQFNVGGAAANDHHEEEEEEVALKVLAAFTKDDKDAADNEVSVMRRLSSTISTTTDHDDHHQYCPNSDIAAAAAADNYIVGLRHHLTNAKSDRRYLAMELCQGGSLRQVMDRRTLCEREAATVFIRFVQALMLCHGKGVVHRDIKPDNVLLLRPWDLSSVKLADFGLAAMFDPTKLAHSSRCCMWGAAGTPGYMAPELLEAAKGSSPCSPWETDVWSAGVVLFEMLTGNLPPPPPPDCPEALLDLESPHLWPAQRCVSFPARHLLQHMLSVNPKKRPALANILKHPWVARFSASLGAVPQDPQPAAATSAAAAATTSALPLERGTEAAKLFPPARLDVQLAEATPSPGRLQPPPVLQNGTDLLRHHQQLQYCLIRPQIRPPQLYGAIHHAAVPALAIRT